MKKLTSILLLSLSLFGCLFHIAELPDIVSANVYDDIESKAKELEQNDTLSTIYSVDNYVERTTIYQFNYQPVPFFRFWRTRVGDCTDKANLKRKMLHYLNISTRSVYGIVHNGEGWGKHDWYEFNINGTYQDIESEMFYGLKKLGSGRW